MPPLIQRIQTSRRLRAAAHHATLFLATRYPDTFPMVFVLGFPKSGTTWACQLIADYLALPFPRFAILPHTFAAVVHGHEVPSPKHSPLVYVARDGRDVALSMFFFELRHLRNNEPQRVPPSLRPVYPTHLRDDTDLRPHFLDFLDLFLRKPHSSRVPWHEHARAFTDHHDRQHNQRRGILRYERLLDQPLDELSTCLRHITHQEPDPTFVQMSIDKFSFQRQAPTGTPDSVRRQGRAGEWRARFSRAAAQRFNDAAGDTLVHLGYEQDRSWPDALPDQPDWNDTRR